MFKNRKILVISGVMSLLIVPTVALGAGFPNGHRGAGVRPAVTGTVASVSGSTITVTGKNGTTYLIDAANATITKIPKTTIQISDIKTGDTLMVFGTVSNNTVTATRISDGVFSARGFGNGKPHTNPGKKGQAISGKITAINGTSLTVTAKNNTVYTIDATNAKIVRKFGTTIQVGDIKIGDTVFVSGTVSGTSVTATMIRDSSQQEKNGVFTGTVTVVNGSSFSLQTKNRGVQTINTDSNTTFKKNGQSAALSDIAVGQTVTAVGVWDSANNTVAATNVNIIIRMLNIRVTGTVQSVSGQTITIVGANSTTYTVDATRAHITYKNGHQGTISIIQNNDTVTVFGRHQSGSDTISAVLVHDTSQTYTQQ